MLVYFVLFHVVSILCSVITLITSQHLTVYFTTVHFKGVVTLELFITLVALKLLHFITRLNLAINKLGVSMFFQVLFLQKCFLPQSISLECAWTLFPPGQGGDGLLLLLLSPGVQGEGGAKGQGKQDGLPLAGQGLAEVQALGHQSRVTSTHWRSRHLHRLE